jgi:leucyl-tRNA synthetase
MAAELSSVGNLDMGALLKAAMASPEIARNKKEAPKYAQKLAKAARSLTREPLELDELQILLRERDYLQAVLGVPVEVCSADGAGPDPLGKSNQAEPGRPAIYIE